MTGINTKQAERRPGVALATLDDLDAEIRRITDAADLARPLGNWSPGQNLQHLARFMTRSLDGFEQGLPFFVRVFGWVLRRVLGKGLFKKTVPAGFRLPVGTPFLPDEEISPADGAAELLAVVERVRRGDPFVPKSPLFGPLSREQWIELHLRHAELHLSFIGLDDRSA